ncbi:hypothetical protein PSAC2689_200123 [Paraburkholderia sacchari]
MRTACTSPGTRRCASSRSSAENQATAVPWDRYSRRQSASSEVLPNPAGACTSTAWHSRKPAFAAPSRARVNRCAGSRGATVFRTNSLAARPASGVLEAGEDTEGGADGDTEEGIWQAGSNRPGSFCGLAGAGVRHRCDMKASAGQAGCVKPLLRPRARPRVFSSALRPFLRPPCLASPSAPRGALARRATIIVFMTGAARPGLVPPAAPAGFV